MFDIHGKDYPEIDIPEGNNIRAYQDWVFVYNGIEPGRYGVGGAVDYTEMLKLIGPRCGQQGDYGNGPLTIRASDIPPWLYCQLGIKPNRRCGDMRQCGSGAFNPLTD